MDPQRHGEDRINSHTLTQIASTPTTWPIYPFCDGLQLFPATATGCQLEVFEPFCQLHIEQHNIGSGEGLRASS